jgi:hypothetical protein
LVGCSPGAAASGAQALKRNTNSIRLAKTTYTFLLFIFHTPFFLENIIGQVTT